MPAPRHHRVVAPQLGLGAGVPRWHLCPASSPGLLAKPRARVHLPLPPFRLHSVVHRSGESLCATPPILNSVLLVPVWELSAVYRVSVALAAGAGWRVTKSLLLACKRVAQLLCASVHDYL
jgi:hypothetical protein